MGELPSADSKRVKNKAASDKNTDRSINGLLEATGLWRASNIDLQENKHGLQPGTGFSALDQELPGSGWPTDGVTELLLNHEGIGELRLLAPALARLSQQQSRWVLLVCPPYIPYPPALSQMGIDLTRIMISQPGNSRDYLWVLEKSLASQSCSAVLAWPRDIHEKQIRRLQLASKEGRCWNVLFRPESVAANASPAELRIRLRPTGPHNDHTAITAKILKRRGRWESPEILIRFDDQLHRPMPDFSEMIITQLDPTSDLPEHPEPVTQYQPVNYEYQ